MGSLNSQAGRLWHLAAIALRAVALSLAVANCSSQGRAVVWGLSWSDSDVGLGSPWAVAAGDRTTTVLRRDGKVFARGWSSQANCVTPQLQGGLQFTKIATNYMSVGLVSDGTLRQWGSYPQGTPTYPIPTIPSGLSAIAVYAGNSYLAALLSDGSAIAWGNSTAQQLNIPVLGPGLRYRHLGIGEVHGLGFVSDGTLRAWGNNFYGQISLPTLPAGVSPVGVRCGWWASALMLSDGSAVAFGYNGYGQCAIPAPGPGLRYDDVAVGGWHTLALRSDGTILAIGNNAAGACTVPSLPSGTRYIAIAAGREHSVALRSDGQVVTWGTEGMEGDAPSCVGSETFDYIRVGGLHAVAQVRGGPLTMVGFRALGNPPTLPNGVSYVDGSAGNYFSAAVCSDGTARVWGYMVHGQGSIPALPQGVSYRSVKCGRFHMAALLSNGSAIAWGDNSSGQCNIPAPPVGTTYVHVGPGAANTLLLRSDGQVVAVGAAGLLSVPALPAGLTYSDCDCSAFFAAALRTDGTIVVWGGPGFTVPPPPVGVAYVNVACGYTHLVARRSDGQVDVFGSLIHSTGILPHLEPGTSVHASDTKDNLCAALIGSKSTYVSFAAGCAGSQPAAKLVPSDTPRLGSTLTIGVGGMPVNVAWLGFAATRLASGIDLAVIGMPGCVAQVAPDVLIPVVGSAGWGRVAMSIPRDPALKGLTFYNQAVILDPASGNAQGVVLSDAAEGTVGG